MVDTVVSEFVIVVLLLFRHGSSPLFMKRGPLSLPGKF